MQPEADARPRCQLRGRIRCETASGTAVDPLLGAQSRGRSVAPYSERVGRRGRWSSGPAARSTPPEQPRALACCHGPQHRSRAAEWAT
ncbi:hypothetical protein NDU88_004545 [Pleurodeles waltl]|uniref:Uncharacterized protein n=1 Tax=Pleurodeles waltl TaxID=8319 RepID=A0AAV7PD48_PLEWA|nr:hypothetical protein NDU88_004545 [Pleurodeles waltl]